MLFPSTCGLMRKNQRGCHAKPCLTSCIFGLGFAEGGVVGAYFRCCQPLPPSTCAVYE